MKDCDGPGPPNHQECPGSSGQIDAIPSVLPTRLLEIQGRHKVRLRVTKDTNFINKHYACLSYCWGEREFISTNHSNLQDHLSDVPWSQLPKTFQEALEISRCLGIRYLWIDSLCIVQNDPEDWLRESAEMAGIYSNSFITLAAADSTDPRGGLLTGRTTYHEAAEITVEEDPRLRLFARIRDGGVHDMPFFNRAWVFQERLLSPRVVYFGARNLSWECRTLTTFDGEINELVWVLGGSRAELVRDTVSDSEGHCARVMQWRRLVHRYSRLRLSHATDIFPALQGITHLLGGYRKTGYYAGLWQDTVLLDLLWFRGQEGCSQYHLGIYRAPSWSWASFVGPIEWCPSETLSPFSHATVMSISTTPVGDDEMGSVTAGYLELQSLCSTSTAARMRSCNNWKPDREDIEENRELLCLRLVGTGDITRRQLAIGPYEYFLVCRCLHTPTEELIQGIYERVGILGLDLGYSEDAAVMWHLEKGGQVRTVHIV